MEVDVVPVDRADDRVRHLLADIGREARKAAPTTGESVLPPNTCQ
jgi:hypothetical protein